MKTLFVDDETGVIKYHETSQAITVARPIAPPIVIERQLLCGKIVKKRLK